jgi:FKBP-type peptidyl-prolyl cis-trans isomerase FklB
MKKLLLIVLGFGLFACGGDAEAEGEAGTAKNQTKITMNSMQEEVSYCIGYSNCEEMKSQLKQGRLEKFVLLPEYLTGFSAVMNGEKGEMDEPEANEILSRYFQRGGMPDTSMITPAKASYALGIQQANLTIRGLEKAEVWQDFNPQFIVVGFEDALYQNTPQVPKEEIIQKVVEYMSRLNELKGEKFLAENGKRPEVTTTESGLQYEIIEPGSGANPTQTDSVFVRYKGSFLDGNIFDQNAEPRPPFAFSLRGGVIMGWLEGVKLMKKGAKYIFYVPHNLAYGPQGMQGGIPPYSTLIFEVELLNFKK